jgi:hypothetical protein
VQAIYDQFTEGFDTADLREAKALMQDLKRSVGRKRNECAGKTADLKRSVARRWNECAGKTDKTSRR